MTEQTITILVQAGAVGIAILLVALLYWVVKNNTMREQLLTTLLGNHTEHQLSATEKQAEAMTNLATSIKELSTIIREKLK